MSKRPLPGDPDGARPPSLALADHLKRLGHAAGDELRKKVRSGISDHFGEFLAQLPPVLAGQGPEGADLALTLSDNHKSWLDTYLQRVDAHILGGKGHRANGAALPERTPAEVTQYREALVNAEAFHRKLVNELNTRVDRIRLTLFLPIYTRALAPVGLVEALSDTADALGWPSSFRPLLFREFEERVLGNLASLYRALIGALRVIEPMAARAVTEGPAPSLPPTLAAPIPEHSAPSAAPLPEVVVHHVPLPKVDSHTVSMLQHFAVDASQTGYNDGSLAADLLSLAENKSLEGLADALRHVPLQRMSLAGQFVSDAISDPFITDELRSRHESVRFPVVKSALADATVFTAASHPINSLVNDLMLKSATSRLTGNVEARMAVERLEQVLVQFDLAPEFVREAMLTQQPIDEAQIQRFLEMKREEAEVRRQAVLNECRRLVSREVERQTFARNITPATLKFLKTIWGPLLMKRLLRDGGDADGWKQGLQLMERLVDEVEMRALEEGSSPEWREMMLLLREALIAEGMSPERAGETLVGMQQRPPPAL